VCIRRPNAPNSQLDYGKILFLFTHEVNGNVKILVVLQLYTTMSNEQGNKARDYINSFPLLRLTQKIVTYGLPAILSDWLYIIPTDGEKTYNELRSDSVH
jgi:hypothetical protein